MEIIIVTVLIVAACFYTVYRIYKVSQNKGCNCEDCHERGCKGHCHLLMLLLLLLPTATLTAQEEEDYKLKIYSNGEFVSSFNNYTGDRFCTEDHKSNTIWVPGILLGAEYRITPKWTAALEGEYITDYGMMLDEFSLTHHVHPAFNIKAGVFGLPFGHHNTDYGYMDYFTAGDPEGDCALFSSPNTEMGVSLLGEFDCGLSYQASITSGMAADMITPLYFFYNAHQGFKEGSANFTSPAYSLRLGYNGIKHLQLGAGVYYCNNIADNVTIDHVTWDKFTGGAPVFLWYADAQFKNDYITARTSFMSGNIQKTTELSYLINECSWEGDNGYLAKQAMSFMGEIGWNLKNTFYPETKGPELMPYAHFEYYDTQKKGDKADFSIEGIAPETVMNPRGQVNLWSFGLNYLPNENIKIKAGYMMRHVGGDKDLGKKNLNSLDIAISYDFDIFTLR